MLLTLKALKSDTKNNNLDTFIKVQPTSLIHSVYFLSFLFVPISEIMLLGARESIFIWESRKQMKKLSIVNIIFTYFFHNDNVAIVCTTGLLLYYNSVFFYRITLNCWFNLSSFITEDINILKTLPNSMFTAEHMEQHFLPVQLLVVKHESKLVKWGQNKIN